MSCDSQGKTPTRKDLLDALKLHSQYNNIWPDTSGDKWTVSDANATVIDHACPNLENRHWEEGTMGKRGEKWKLDDDGNEEKHPRRYGDKSTTAQKASMELTENLSERLRAMTNSSPDDHIPWSLSYVGWTRKEA